MLGVQHVAHGASGIALGYETVVRQPLVVEDLGQVAAARVGQQDDDEVVRRAGRRDLQSSDRGHAARATDQQSFFTSQPPGHRERVGVAHCHDGVDDRRVVGARPEVLADPFDEIGAAGPSGVHRALGIGAHHLHRTIGHLLEVTAGPRDGASRSDARNEVRDRTFGLLPQLRAGGRVVRRGVVQVGVLVGLPPAGDLARQPVADAVVRVRVLGRHRRRTHLDLRAIGPQHADLVLRHLVGDDEDAVVAALLRDERQPHSGVPRRRFDDRAPRCQEPVTLGRVDHRHRDAVLHRTARIDVLNLGVDRGRQAFGDRSQPHQRGATDEIDDRVDNAHLITLEAPHLRRRARTGWSTVEAFEEVT